MRFPQKPLLGLFTKVPDQIEQEGPGIYRIDLFFRSIVILVPNEMQDKEANDVFELFTSQKSQYFLRPIGFFYDSIDYR